MIKEYFKKNNLKLDSDKNKKKELDSCENKTYFIGENENQSNSFFIDEKKLCDSKYFYDNEYSDDIDDYKYYFGLYNFARDIVAKQKKIMEKNKKITEFHKFCNEREVITRTKDILKKAPMKSELDYCY